MEKETNTTMRKQIISELEKRIKKYNEYMRNYQKTHREQHRMLQKRYYENNKEKYKTYVRKLKTCEICGTDKEYLSSNFSKHCRTKKHLNNIENND